MATLTGQTVAATYDLLLKVSTVGIDGTLRTIQDGVGADSALDLSTGAVRSTGSLTVDGISTLTGAVTAAAGVTGDLTGNADTATTATTATNVTVADTADATCFVGLFESATGNLPPKSDAGLTYAADTGTLTATALVGPLTGDVTGYLTGGVTGNVTGNVTGDIKAADGNVAFNSGATIAESSLGDGVTATTQTASDDSTKVATTAYVDALTPVPAGAITQYGAASAPTGWLLCNGAEKDSISDTTLAALYAVIGNTYGGSDGSDFLLPDLQGNVAVGKDSSTFSALGGTGGVETHTLTESEMPSHTHDVTRNRSDNTAVGSGLLGTGAGIAVAVTSDTAGSGNAHTNLQPYLVLNYIIKT